MTLLSVPVLLILLALYVAAFWYTQTLQINQTQTQAMLINIILSIFITIVTTIYQMASNYFVEQ